MYTQLFSNLVIINLLAYEDGTDRVFRNFFFWAYKIQTPGNYPEENIQHTEHGESLKSKVLNNLGVVVALGIQHAIRMHHTVFCGLPHSTTFFHIIS
jgi:hypothetical protein